MGTIEADRVLDTRGLFCPVPIIKTADVLDNMESGEILKVVSDDRGIGEDMQAWCRANRNELMEISENDGEFTAYVRKK